MLGALVKVFGVAGIGALAVRFIVNDISERRAAKRENFSEYSRRYAELLAEIVEVADLCGPFDPSNEKHRSVAVRFFMLLSEEEFLSRLKLIDQEVIDVWRKGLTDTMRHRFFQEAWVYVRQSLHCPLADGWVKAALADS